MKNMHAELVEIINLFSPGDGLHKSAVPGVYCIKISQPYRRSKNRWGASLSIVAQGGKEIVLGRETYRFSDVDYIATPIDLPVVSRIFAASPEKPFLALKIGFDPLTLSEVAVQLDSDFPEETENPLRAVFGGRASEAMMEALVRLARLLKTPVDAPILGPLTIKEVFYHLLKGSDGPAIRQFVRSGSKMHKISQAVFSLRANLHDDVDVAALAKAARMSRSAFFKHFKEVTSVSPIQYQKRLRLLEAKRLMIEEGQTAEGAAFKVGYNSPSQFSREYSRMFGNAPVRDVVKMKQHGVSSET
jgi:AraC-like DNA-binding protein